jgi:hypothetical protein
MPSAWAVFPSWLRGTLTPYEIAVYVVLGTYTDGKNYCYPSIPAIAEGAGMSERTVQRAVRSLAEKGLLDVTRRFNGEGDRTSNGYRLEMNPPTVVSVTTLVSE